MNPNFKVTSPDSDDLAPGKGDPGPHPNEGQARIFVTLWVIASSAHYFEDQPFYGWPVLLAGIPCLLIPGSAAAFGVFVVVGTGVVAIHLPAAANHFVLTLLIHMVLMASAAAVMLGKTKPQKGDFLPATIRQAIVPASLVLLVVYFFTIFHKLNTSFFDPDVSCSGRLLSQGLRLQKLPFESIPDRLILLSAILTVAVEALILLLLAVRSTRRWGVLLGFGFHFLLAWAKFYDFSTFVFALYVLVLAAESPGLVPNMERWRRVGVAGWVLFGSVSVAKYLTEGIDSPLGPTWHTLQVITWALAVGPVFVPLLIVNLRMPLVPRAWKAQPAWLLVFPLLAFVNGALPYLGLKTVATYSMFSNLRTEERRTNHFLRVVESVQVSNTTSDTVDIFEIEFPNDRRLGTFEKLRGGEFWLMRQIRWIGQEGTVRVPWLELRRAAHVFKDANIRGVYVDYSHQGERRQVADAASDPVLTAPLPFLTKRLQAFREIEQGNRPVACRW